MIHGYPANASLAPGERLVLHVSTDAPRFRVVVYRWGEALLPVHRTAWLAGRHAAPRGADDDWDWPPYAIPLPPELPSAVYIAHLEEPGAAPPTLAMDSAAALFVVRGKGRGKLLYKLPIATYQAYNYSGGGCYYNNPPRSLSPPGAKVSLRRPGGGIGGPTWGAADYYDASSPRQTFAHWDAPFIRWLLQAGYRPEFCTDLDIHRDPSLCGRYRLLVSAGHDEYWSEATRNRVEGFVSGGGNVAFFAGNLCWWRVHYADDGAAMVCHQGGPDGALDHWWPASGAHRPEDGLAGVSYRHGGGWWDGPRDPGGFIVQQPAHWAFAGTGLRRGAAFGADTAPPLVGYECDGAPLAAFNPESGLAALSPLAARCGTPPSFLVLAACPLDERWQERPPREGCDAGAGIHAAVMGVFSRSGTVFTAGTTDWPQVVAGGDARVGRITRNVLDRLLEH